MSDRLPTTDVAVQDFLEALDVDAFGVATLSDLAGSNLGQTALNLLPEARSIVVFAMEVYSEILNHSRPERAMGKASFNDLVDRNTEFLSGRLTKAAYGVARVSHRNSLKALPLPAIGCPLDVRFLEAVFSYKDAGQATGLGYVGRSGLLITKVFGPRVRLSCCLTEALLEPTKVIVLNACEGCRICIENCPAGALTKPEREKPYAINKFACASFRNASGGCSECMRLCPAGS